MNKIRILVLEKGAELPEGAEWEGMEGRSGGVFSFGSIKIVVQFIYDL